MSFPPQLRRALRTRRALALGAVAVVAVLAAGTAVAVFAARSGPGGCQDVRRPGLDPALERLVPASFENRPPDRLDSSTTCSAAGLGTLARRGLTSVSSAGGLWDLGPSTGITLAVFRVAGPDRASWIADFYTTGAVQAPKVTGLRTTHPTVAGRPATRLDFSDAGFPQSIVVWPAADPDVVNVVLAAGVPDRIVEEGIAAFGSR